MHRLLELAHTITITKEVYVGTVSEYGKATATAQLSDFYTSVIISAFIDFTAQAFFCFRVRKFSKRWIVASVCFIAAFVRLILFIMVGVLGLIITDFHEFQARWGWLGAATDVVIALAMCYYLRQHRASAFAR